MDIESNIGNEEFEDTDDEAGTGPVDPIVETVSELSVLMLNRHLQRGGTLELGGETILGPEDAVDLSEESDDSE